MSENWVFQVSPKLPDGTLVNVRGDNADEFFANIEAVIKIAPSVAALSAALAGVGNLAAAGVTGTPVVQQAAPQQQATVTPIQSGPPAPVCKHGQMAFKNGVGKKGPWSAYFCANKDAPDKCDPIWQ